MVTQYVSPKSAYAGLRRAKFCLRGALLRHNSWVFRAAQLSFAQERLFIQLESHGNPFRRGGKGVDIHQADTCKAWPKKPDPKSTLNLLTVTPRALTACDVQVFALAEHGLGIYKLERTIGQDHSHERRHLLLTQLRKLQNHDTCLEFDPKSSLHAVRAPRRRPVRSMRATGFSWVCVIQKGTPMAFLLLAL